MKRDEICWWVCRGQVIVTNAFQRDSCLSAKGSIFLTSASSQGQQVSIAWIETSFTSVNAETPLMSLSSLGRPSNSTKINTRMRLQLIWGYLNHFPLDLSLDLSHLFFCRTQEFFRAPLLACAHVENNCLRCSSQPWRCCPVIH